MRRPSPKNKQNRLTFKALSLRRKDSPYFRETGCNPAVVLRGMAVYEKCQRRFELFY